jgi:hypothetical protein
MATPLILKRAPIGDNQEDYDVLENGKIRWPHLLPRCCRAAEPALDVGERPTTVTSARSARVRANARGCDGGVR